MRMTIRVEGLGDARRNLAKMLKAIDRGVVEVIITDAVEPVADSARHYAPKETGRLSDGIIVSTDAIEPERLAEVDVYVGPTQDIEYALPVEMGTPDGVVGPGQFYPGTAPHPYLRPAFDEGVDRAIKTIAQNLIDRALEAGS